jgi:hypothetical protein
LQEWHDRTAQLSFLISPSGALLPNLARKINPIDMSMQDYKRTIRVAVAPEKVFDAIINHIGDWWTDDVEGATAAKGDKFTVRFGRTYKTMEILDLGNSRRVEWECLDQHIDVPAGIKPLANNSEWVGTRIVWEISAHEEKSVLTFTHHGLNPGSECWTICAPGWDQSLESLMTFLTTGVSILPFKQLNERPSRILDLDSQAY